MQALNIENLKSLTVAVAKLGVGMAGVLEDGTVTISDMKHIPAILGGLRSLSVVEYKKLLPEMKDLNDAEREELGKLFGTEFNIVNDSLEATIEQGLALLLMALQAIMTFVSIGEKVKTAEVK